MLAATGIVSAVFALILGRTGDRIGHPTVLTVCLLGAAISHFPQYFVQQVWQLLLLRTLTGCFLGGLMPSANAIIAGMVSPPEARRRLRVDGYGQRGVNAAGPLSGAYITAQWGMREVFLATGLLFTLTFGWVAIGFRRHREQMLKQQMKGDATFQTQPAGRSEQPPTG